MGDFYPPQTVTADQIIGTMKTAISQAKAQGLKVYLGTLTPYEGSAFFESAGEAKRQAVNAFVRSGAGADGIIDFEKAVWDPSAPTKLLAAYDNGDHIHPNDAGYQAMANAVNPQHSPVTPERVEDD